RHGEPGVGSVKRGAAEQSAGANPSVLLAPAGGVRSMPASLEARSLVLPATPDRGGKTASRKTKGEGTPLVIDKDAARKAVSGHLVVDRLLSPFQANPRVIVDELRATAWKHQGVVTVQEVASDDGRFVLNFAAEGDRRFMLKAQPWHYKRDGLVFAEFDGKGDPTEIDLGVMAIWVQVRGLPFELKTESMGWSFWDQIGEVLEVSHHNHVIVEKFLRVRVEVILHEPLKSTVEFIPLGSSKIVKYDVLYEKLPLYYECCGIVGHTSERFCNIPSDKGVPTFPKNLSVE
uniref:Uncharacterized protein n=1 Tax=Aegilops tauschii subsp. strangulata TaxID=200361 RepID=A0A453SH60_AEGTS